jgi:hypothetical protein
MTTPLDISDFVYQTGTLTIAATDTTAVFTGSSLSANIKDGDYLFAGGALAPIQTVTDDTHVELFTGWAGADVTAGTYLILKASLLRYHTALVGYDAATFLAMLDGLTVFYVVTGDEPDPSLGEDGQFAIKTNAGAWVQWIKTGGVWVLQATPVGVNWRGAWNSATAYAINDSVQRLGSTYVSKTSNTNAPPESSTSDWDLSSAKGDAGRDGGVIAIPYTFSTTTSDSDPGDGVIRLGPGASQKAATVWRADVLDVDGKDWTGTLADLAASTSAVKCAARLYKKSDQTARIVGNVTAFATPTGYRNLTFVATSGDDNPFTNGDAVILVLDRTGDKGDIGLTGPKGSTYRGTWASVTAYAVDDVVTKSGTSYISIQAGTNKDPSSEPTYWSVYAAKGDPGLKGDTPVISGTSTSSVTVGTGSKSLTTQTGLALVAGHRIRVANADASKVLIGIVSSYTTGTGALAWTVDGVVGSGSDTSWTITLTGETGATGPTGPGFTWKGIYSSATAYAVNDVVGYSGKAYINIQAGTNQQPDTATAYWTLYIDTPGIVDSHTVQGISSNYTAAIGDRGTMLRCTASLTLAMTAAATLTNGWYCYVKADGGTVTIDPDSSETVDGATSLTLSNGSALILFCTGSGFITFRTSSGGGSLSTMTENVQTADYTTLATDLGKRVLMNSASAHTITLLAAATAGAGFSFFVRNINTGLLTVDANSSETIDGDLTFVLDKDEEALLSCTGTGWRKQVWRSEGHLDGETDVATGSTMDIGATNTERVRATGSTGVTSFGTRPYKFRIVRWTAQVSITYNATSMVLPGGANMVTENGECWYCVSDGSGNWRVLFIQKNQAPARGRLTADLTLYVRPDGSDANDGRSNTSGGAYLTIQRAIDVIASTVDIAGFNVTIQIADGTYTNAITLKNVVGFSAAGNLVIQGNNATPANSLISVSASAPCFNADGLSTTWDIKDLKMENSGAANSFGIQALSGSKVRFGNVNFGACAAGHMNAFGPGSVITALSNYAVSGGGARHFQAFYGAQVVSPFLTVTISNTPNYTVAWADVEVLGSCQVHSMTFSGTGATGARYKITNGAVLFTNGNTTTYLPGNAAGTGTNFATAPYGLYA